MTTGSITLNEAKRHYETEMLRYGFTAAANSTMPYFAEAMRRYPERPTRT